MNAVEIEEAVSALCENSFDPNEFPYQFLEAFGEKATTIKRLRSKKNCTNKSDISGALLQRNNIHLLVCETGKVNESLKSLVSSSATKKHKAQFALVTDGEFFEAENLNNGETLACLLKDLPDHFGFFLSLAGIATVKKIRDNAFDIKATSRMNRLYVELQQNNPDWDTDQRREDLNHFFARLIFCLFAEDTGIFNQSNLFTGAVQAMSEPDGSNTHEILSKLFQAMNLSPSERESTNLPRYAAAMPYVNGGLFDGSADCPKFTRIARSYLIHIGNLDWKKINPDIFGSMIQAVAEDEKRGELGMHYTSVPNILKVLNPLFLDGIRDELREAGSSKRKLMKLRTKIARIRVFDPACGSGNFLVVAYKELRAIEAEINRLRGEEQRESEIPLTNFRGIELRSFAAEIARLALLISQFQCDVEYRGLQLAVSEAIPLSEINWITCGNALRLNWNKLCPSDGKHVEVAPTDTLGNPTDKQDVLFENTSGQTFICSNPPYLGSRRQTSQQKKDMRDLLDSKTAKWKSLDYVAGWLVKAAEYCKTCNASAAFVMTNSICQGLPVSIVWPIVLTGSVKIHFAHTSFKWSNLAKGKAGVSVIIAGITGQSILGRYIYEEDEQGQVKKTKCQEINPYLVRGKTMFIHERQVPITSRPLMDFGNMPRDGGNLLLSTDEAHSIQNSFPDKSNGIIRRYLGSDELIKGKIRYCIWMPDPNLDEYPKSLVRKLAPRFKRVREMRLASSAEGTQKLAMQPHRFGQIQSTARSYSIAIPAQSSEKRKYLPIDCLSQNCVHSNTLFAIYDSGYFPLSILSSRLHLIWVAAVCGRLETRYRYSKTLGWNTFPLPALSTMQIDQLDEAAKTILVVREKYWPATLQDMYDPDRMHDKFPKLLEAHNSNDEIIERIYIGRRFKNDTERLQKLFEMYAEVIRQEPEK